MPVTVAEKLITERDRHLYINLPKLKTHSMGVVTLGIKNQWGFPAHADRSVDHNFNLHNKFVDILSHVQPDFTLIEGVEGTIHGHYHALPLADRVVKPFRVLIGGPNVVATDIVGAGVFGFSADDVPHIRIALERGLGNGVKRAEDIDLIGDYNDIESLDILGELADFNGKYPFDLYPEFPGDVTIVKGKNRACREGCVNNPLSLLQILSTEFQGKGGWTLVMGRGFDAQTIEGLKGPVLIAGHCAIEEVATPLIRRLGRRQVYLSGECNDLQATTEAMCHIMKIDPTRLVSINPIKSLGIVMRAKLNRSHGKLVRPFAHIVKLR